MRLSWTMNNFLQGDFGDHENAASAVWKMISSDGSKILRRKRSS